jgi:uncharacterized membrane protein (UPF0127 family)
MLFVFPGLVSVRFWMKDTPLPLSLAFIDGRRRVVGITDMAPFTTVQHPSPRPVRYALEVTGGFFARHRIGVGSRVVLPGTLAAR